MNKEILRLAIPNILTNLSIPLLSSVDTALMGRLDNEKYLGAIALAGIIFNFVYWGFGFLRMGTTGITAQFFGSKQNEESALTLARSLMVGLIAAIALLILQEGIAWLSFNMMQGTSETEEIARQYFHIRIWAAPATLALYSLYGWLLGMQNAKDPLYIVLVVNLGNILFNIVFVKYYDMKADGVAWGTVCAQYLGFVVAIFILLKKYRWVFSHFKWSLISQLTELKRFFLINRDLFLRTMCLIVVFTFFTAKSAQEGDVLLAVNAILLQMFYIVSYGVDGFAFAAESMVGKYFGAKDKTRLKQALKAIMIWGIGMALVASLVYWAFGMSIYKLFTNQVDLIEAVKPYLWWIIVFPLTGAVAFIWDGVFIGLTKSKIMRNTMFLAMVLFLGVYYLFHPIWFNHALWMAMIAFMVVRGISLSWAAFKYDIY